MLQCEELWLSKDFIIWCIKIIQPLWVRIALDFWFLYTSKYFMVVKAAEQVFFFSIFWCKNWVISVKEIAQFNVSYS